jgi:hypothetical protein
MDRGFLSVEAVRQPVGRPMILTTPHSEATVLGTEFTLYATALYTRLDVREGRVKFTRLPGVTSIIVTGSHYAIAGTGFELASRSSYTLWKASPYGLQLWLRADVGVKGSGSSVSAWSDQSFCGNHAVQPVPASQPMFVANVAGGRPALRFDGAENFLALPAGFGDFRAGLTAFLVVRVGATPASMRFLDFDVGPTCDNLVFARKDAPDRLAFWAYANCLTRGKVEAGGAILLDQFQTLSVVDAPQGKVMLYRNGLPVGTGITSVARDVPRKPNYIGHSSTSGDPNFKGDLAEVILYNRALSESERMAVEAYFVSKYFDSTAPPVATRPEEK